MNEVPVVNTRSVTIGGLSSVIFLAVSSLGYAYSSQGFGGASLINHIQALVTLVASAHLMISLG